MKSRPFFFARVALLSLAGMAAGFAAAQDGNNTSYVPKAGQFPPAGAGVYLSGELVYVDHVNRRGAMRLAGDGDEGRYHSAPSHRFALLPYGTIRYHGAPAELRDIPLGTVLHGRFTLPPEGDTTIAPPPPGNEKYVSKHTHALFLEDDFSFYQRQGQAWKIVSSDWKKGHIKVVSTGPAATDGLTGARTFEVDQSTRVWKGREAAMQDQVAVDQVVQLNLSWSPDWQNGAYFITDIWLDDASRTLTAEHQRQVHIRHQRHRGLPGWIDHVEHQAGGKGIVTVTLFSGMDTSLYDVLRLHTKNKNHAQLGAAEWTLRTWWHNHDNKGGPVLELKELPTPPQGSSGIQLRVQIGELLEGYRPGRIVRVWSGGFGIVRLPPEERIKSMEEKKQSKTAQKVD